MLEPPPAQLREPQERNEHSQALRAGRPFALMATNGRYVSCDLSSDHGLCASATHIQEWELFRVYPPA